MYTFVTVNHCKFIDIEFKFICLNFIKSIKVIYCVKEVCFLISGSISDQQPMKAIK